MERKSYEKHTEILLITMKLTIFFSDLEKENFVCNTQNINILNNRINNLMKSPAEKFGMLIRFKARSNGKGQIYKKSNVKKGCNSWFDKSCMEIRKDYFKLKNEFRKYKSVELKETLKLKSKELKCLFKKKETST